MSTLKTGVIGLVLVTLLVAAAALALDSFQENLDPNNACVFTGSTFNETTRLCYYPGTNSSNTTPLSSAFNSTQEGLLGTANASSYFSTIGTLIGVGALVAVVIGAFMFIRRRS